MRNRDESNLSVAFLEGMLGDYLRDPGAVPADWQEYLDDLLRSDPQWRSGNGLQAPARPQPIRSGTNGKKYPARPPGEPRPPVAASPGASGNGQDLSAMLARQDRVDQLIRNHRVRGHMIAQLDPLGRPRPPAPELEPAFFGLDESDLDRTFSTESMPGPRMQTLRQILSRLRDAYCQSIGVQFMHIDDVAIRRWIQDRIEAPDNPVHLTKDQQVRILRRLTDAVVFEQVVQKKYVGATTFSLEGAETLIPLVDLAIEKAGAQGVAEIVLAMSHRGRLNVLANIMAKSAVEIFREFEDVGPTSQHGGGDVKYHLGYSSTWNTTGGQCVHLSLCFNPSHLEFINPVALGRTRAKQDRAGDTPGDKGMALLIHSDAGFAGQGVVQEMLNLSQLPAYRTGGTLHLIINNQIGFTTPPEQARSSVYCTDVVKMLQVPIFHVNGEDPEAAATVVQMAMDFRHEFHRDVVIDMYCYRRHGHNEGDEPAFTQPLLYDTIAHRPPVWQGYLEHLEQRGDVTRAQTEEFIAAKTKELDDAHAQATAHPAPIEPYPHKGPRRGIWAGYVGGSSENAVDVNTAVERDRLVQFLDALTHLPADFHPHRKIERGLAQRREMAQGKRPLDWAAAEALALGSLAVEGHRVRLTGQDCERGTFSQRHAVLNDVSDGHTYTPLQHLHDGQAQVNICNSPLSEIAVMGFDYGYSMDYPEALVLWEAQYGDFCNVAQVIIDQFICSAEEKWNRLSGLVLLLPHSFEGQGPEHSSARLERWLALGADDNIQVVYPSTPAQYFHVLRRQALSRWRKPLVVMTPKGLLRHPQVISTLDDCAAGSFQPVVQDVGDADPASIGRVLLCSGKIYYELAGYRAEKKHADVAIVRLEQLYPLPRPALRAALERFPAHARAYWVQEEPRNMGAWPYLRDNLGCDLLFDRQPFAGIFRPESSSPGTGSPKAHKLEQQRLIMEAFGDA